MGKGGSMLTAKRQGKAKQSKAKFSPPHFTNTQHVQGKERARTQLFRKLIVITEDFHDGVQHPKAHRNLRLHLVNPLLSRRRVHIEPLQIRLGNRPARARPLRPILLGGDQTKKDKEQEHSRYLLMFDREQFKSVHDDS